MTEGERLGGPPARKEAPDQRGRPDRPRSRATDTPGASGPLPTGDDGAEEVWILEEVRDEATGAVRRGGASTRGATPPTRRARPNDTSGRAKPPEADLSRELESAVGPRRAPRLEGRLRDAARAFNRERYPEARAQLRKLAQEAPRSASVRELLGLTYYRLGQWKDAARELETFRTLTGSTEQHPVLADSLRALGRHAAVEELWDELREASPGAELVAEGRIVMAGSQADRGMLPEAIATLAAGRWRTKHPRDHHLRMAYALGDLYERAGELPKARELFDWVGHREPGFADVAERRRSLG